MGTYVLRDALLEAGGGFGDPSQGGTGRLASFETGVVTRHWGSLLAGLASQSEERRLLSFKLWFRDATIN